MAKRCDFDTKFMEEKVIVPLLGMPVLTKKPVQEYDDIRRMIITKDMEARVTLDLRGLNAWKKTRLENGDSFNEDVETVTCFVKYVPLVDAKEYGFYGWCAPIPNPLSFNSKKNLGCLNRELECSPALKAKIRGGKLLGRTSCESDVKSFSVPLELSDELLQVLGKAGWQTVNVGINGNWAHLDMRFPVCPLKEKCNHRDDGDLYFSEIHLPMPGEDKYDAKTTFARMMFNGAAAVVARLIDPSYPDRQGIYALRNKQHPMPIDLGRLEYASCESCMMHKLIIRSNDTDEGDMGQTGIPMTKAEGLDQRFWCRDQEDWNRVVGELEADLNEQNIKGDAARGMISKCLKQTVCPFYTWRAQTLNYHLPYALAVKNVHFMDGEQPQIVAKLPQLDVVCDLNETVANRQRNFR